MQVAHIVGGDLTRGAHRGAYWLHLGLKELGVGSSIVGPMPVMQQDADISSTSEGFFCGISDALIAKADGLLLKPYFKRPQWAFSTGFFGREIANYRAVKQADVINLHWISRGPVSMRGLERLSRLGKPIVWTLRDMWPFTGGCHYSMECTRYLDDCGFCPQLGSKRAADLSRMVHRRKERYISKTIKMVGISDWLSDCARQSRLLRDCDIRTIPNCIDTNRFMPLPRKVARDKLGVRSDKKIILVGAEKVTNFNKGFDSFLDAARLLDNKKMMVLTFGESAAVSGLDTSIEVMNLGYLSTDSELRVAYSAADVFVAPSRQEAFGKTLVEAMACGTPVVCFDSGGPKDIVSHRVTGYKAVPFDAKDLAAGIRWVLDNSDAQCLGENSVRRAVAEFGKGNVARRYVTLYEEMISESR